MAPNMASSSSAISTHALREEGDVYDPPVLIQSLISTHALREEGDQFSDSLYCKTPYFYPRPP